MKRPKISKKRKKKNKKKKKKDLDSRNHPSRFTRSMRIKSVGSLDDESVLDIPFFLPKAKFYRPITIKSIKNESWLGHREDVPQTFEDYKKKYNSPSSEKRTIYVVSLEKKARHGVSIEGVVEYIQLFFSRRMRVRLLDTSKIKNFSKMVKNVTYRMDKNGDGKQLLVSDIFLILKKILPEDAYCLTAVTCRDLYPRAGWTFVFGKAHLYERFAVFSYRRYRHDPKTTQFRLQRVCSHEICHMFGMRHCIFYRCLMNGSMSLKESDQRPQVLCPVCLRKLHYCVRFSIKNRYIDLYKYYRQRGEFYKKPSKWIIERLQYQKDMNNKKYDRKKLNEIFLKEIK